MFSDRKEKERKKIRRRRMWVLAILVLWLFSMVAGAMADIVVPTGSNIYPVVSPIGDLTSNDIDAVCGENNSLLYRDETQWACVDADDYFNTASSASNPFNQSLNTTDSVTFVDILATGKLNVTGESDLYDHLSVYHGNGRIVSSNSAGSMSLWTDAEQAGSISFGNTADIGISRDGTVDGYDYDGGFIFKQKASNPDGIGEFIFIEENGDWRFALPKSGADYGTYNPRSMIIAGASWNNGSNFNCSLWGFNQLDCDTGGTGADLGVQDDLQVLGIINAQNITSREGVVNITGTVGESGLILGNTMNSSAIGNGIFRDTLIVLRSTETNPNIAQRAGVFVVETNNSASEGVPYYGFNAFAVHSGAGKLTRTAQAGGIASGRYGLTFDGSGSATKGGAVSAIVNILSASTGTLEHAYVYQSEGCVNGGGNIGNCSGFYAEDSIDSDGTFNYSYGFTAEPQTAGELGNAGFFANDYAISAWRHVSNWMGSNTEGELTINANGTLNLSATNITHTGVKEMWYNQEKYYYDENRSKWLSVTEYGVGVGRNAVDVQGQDMRGVQAIIFSESQPRGYPIPWDATFTGFSLRADDTPNVRMQFFADANILHNETWTTSVQSNLSVNQDITEGEQLLMRFETSPTNGADRPHGTLFYRQRCGGCA